VVLADCLDCVQSIESGSIKLISGDPLGITALIITLNEQRHIRECIQSVKWCTSVLVVDSGSSDATCQLAQEAGAIVLVHPFVNNARQYNWGLEQISTPWALVLDADERCTDDLRGQLMSVLPGSEAAALRVRRRNHAFGVWIRHGGWYPDWTTRVFRVGRARYEDRQAHADVLTDGAVLSLPGHIDHYTYETVSEYLRKLNSTTTNAAVDRSLQVQRGIRPEHLSITQPRRVLKYYYQKLPARPLIRFLWMYVFRLGFLDGRAGLILALFSAMYEVVTDAKSWGIDAGWESEAISKLNQRTE
jgi:glycosyltransferase involved in cell wall biosynthesis